MIANRSADRDRPRIFKIVRPVFALAAFVSMLAACGPHTPIQHCASGSVTRLYMGQSTPRGNVTEAQWQHFVAETVTPRYPEGFTVLSAQGQWRAGDGSIQREDTRVLEIVHSDDPQARAQVQALAHAYKRRFSQENVLLTQSPSLQCSLINSPQLF